MKDFVQTQKIIKVGNSYAVTLDSKFVETHHIEAGDPIVASYAPTHVAFAVPNEHPMMLRDQGKTEYNPKLSDAEKRAVVHSKITPEFVAWVDNMLKEDKEALKELANL